MRAAILAPFLLLALAGPAFALPGHPVGHALAAAGHASHAAVAHADRALNHVTPVVNEVEEAAVDRTAPLINPIAGSAAQAAVPIVREVARHVPHHPSVPGALEDASALSHFLFYHVLGLP